MIRRSPTRIELKLEDLHDFDYIQKFEKKKSAAGTVVSSAETQKLLRQERIGLGFRPIRSSSNVGNGGGSQQGSITTTPATTSAIGSAISANNSVGIAVVTPSDNNDNTVDINVTNTNQGLNLIPEEDNAHANNSTMSFDDSL